MTTSPTISCIIPAYEHLDQFGRCLLSLIAQQGVDLEIIVSDDSRSSRIADLCTALTEFAPAVRYVAGPRSGNPVDNWNAGLDLARGRYAIVVHQDEFLVSRTFLARAAAALDTSHEEAVFGRITPIAVERRSKFGMAGVLARVLGLRPWMLFMLNWIGPTATAVFRNRSDRRFDRTLVNLVDVEFLFRLCDPKRAPRLLAGIAVSGLAHHGDQITASIDRHLLSHREIAGIVARQPSFSARQAAILKAVMRARLEFSRRSQFASA